MINDAAGSHALNCAAAGRRDCARGGLRARRRRAICHGDRRFRERLRAGDVGVLRTTAGYKPPPSQRDCAFVAWAPDSSRLLLPLRVEINGTVRDWKVYWNTRTRSFELTPFLTELNARAVEESFSSLKPFCAEPVDPLPSLEALDRQIAEARAAFDEDWKECSAAEKQRLQKAAPRT